MTTRIITVSITAMTTAISPEQRLARKRERDAARTIRRCRRFIDRLFNSLAVVYCVLLLLASVLTVCAL